MMQFLFELIVNLMVNLTLVKIIFFRSETPKEDSTRWKTAADAMLLMETRLEQLTTRDIKQQERVWTLEDQNRDLQQLLARARGGSHPPLPSPPTSDEDDDDRDSAIPPNSS